MEGPSGRDVSHHPMVIIGLWLCSLPSSFSSSPSLSFLLNSDIQAFRCVLASLFEGLSVHPSVRPSVGNSFWPLRWMELSSWWRGVMRRGEGREVATMGDEEGGRWWRGVTKGWGRIWRLATKLVISWVSLAPFAQKFQLLYLRVSGAQLTL